MEFRVAVCALVLMMLLSGVVENSPVFRNTLIDVKPAKVTMKLSKNTPIDYRFRSDYIISEELPVSFENEDGRPKFR